MAYRNNMPNLQKSPMVLSKIRKTRLNFKLRPPKTRKRKKRRIRTRSWKRLRRRRLKKMRLLRSKSTSSSLHPRKSLSINFHLSRILWLNKLRSRLKLKRLRYWYTKSVTSSKRSICRQSRKWRLKLLWKQLRRPLLDEAPGSVWSPFCRSKWNLPRKKKRSRRSSSNIKAGLKSRNKRQLKWSLLSRRRQNQKK